MQKTARTKGPGRDVWVSEFAIVILFVEAALKSDDQAAGFRVEAAKTGAGLDFHRSIGMGRQDRVTQLHCPGFVFAVGNADFAALIAGVLQILLQGSRWGCMWEE